MKMRIVAFVAALFALPGAGWAACANTYSAKDAGGSTVTFCRGTDGGTSYVSYFSITDSAGGNPVGITSNALDVNVKSGGTVAQESTTSGQGGSLVMGAVTTSAPSYTTAKTDMLSLTTAGSLRVAPDANSAVNVAQINGVTPLMGAGNTGTGSPRVTVSTDQAALATWGHGATGAAPPAGMVQIGANASGATGGLMRGLIACDLHAKYDASDTGSITLVTGVSGRKVYVCGYILATGGTATNLKLREGSDANCATNAADLTPAYQLVANDKIGANSAFWNGLAASTNAYYVCVNASAGNAHQAEIWYTIL